MSTQNFEELLNEIPLPRKINISRIEVDDISGELHQVQINPHGSLPSIEAFQSSQIVADCRRIFNSNNESILAELPEFLVRLVYSRSNIVETDSFAEKERRFVQREYDDEVSTHTLRAIIERIGEPAVSAMLSTLKSDKVDLRVKVIDVLKESKIFTPALIRGVIKRLGASIVESNEEGPAISQIRDQLLEDFPELQWGEPSEYTVIDSETERRIRDAQEEYLRIISEAGNEQGSIYSYLLSATEPLGDYFSSLLSFVYALTFDVNFSNFRTIQHEELLIKSYKDKPHENHVHLVNGLRSDRPQIRITCLNLICKLAQTVNFEDVTTYVGDLLYDPVDYVNHHAIETLKALGRKAASYGEEVLNIAKSENDPRSILAISALGRLGEPQKEAVNFLTTEWKKFKELEADPEFTTGKPGDKKTFLQTLKMIFSFNRTSEDTSIPNAGPEARIILRAVLESLGSFLDSSEQARQVFDEAIEMSSQIVRDGLIAGLENNANFDSVKGYLIKAMRTQASCTKLVLLAYRYGSNGEALAQEFRAEVFALAEEAQNYEDRERYKSFLEKLDKALAHAAAAAKYHRENKTGHFFV